MSRLAASMIPKPFRQRTTRGSVTISPGCGSAMACQRFRSGATSPPDKPIVIRVKVKPNSRVSTLEQVEDGTWLAQLRAAPVDGKANEELIALVASRFACRKSAVSITSGASGRIKLVRIVAS